MTRASKILARFAGIALTLMVVIVVVDVFGRRVGWALHGGIELSVLALVALGFLALPWSLYARSHITVEIATAWLTPGSRSRIDRFWSLILALVLAALAWLTLEAGIGLNVTGQTTEIMKIPPLLPYGFAAFGLFAAALAAARLAVRRRNSDAANNSQET